MQGSSESRSALTPSSPTPANWRPSTAKPSRNCGPNSRGETEINESELIAKAKSLVPVGDSMSAVLRLVADRDRLREALADCVSLARGGGDKMGLLFDVKAIRERGSAALAEVPE